MSRESGSQRDRSDVDSDGLRIALVFDAIFPVTKGGAERWFTALATELSSAGHEVTYVTSERGERGERGISCAFQVCEVSRGGGLYDAKGRRRLMPSLLFSVAVARFLRRNRRSFDIVYVHQTPLFPVITARLALGGRAAWAVEWIEWWPRDYWRRYAPGLVGVLGWWIQRLALQCTPLATVFAGSTEGRLRTVRPTLRVAMMPGQLLETAPRPESEQVEGTPLVLFVGRLVPEKHPHAFLDAVEELARRRPVSGAIVGQGPLLDELRQRAASLVGASVTVTGPVEQDVLEALYRDAAVLLHPSEREGFGLVVTEAGARGVPVVVVAGEDNAAVELVTDGVNGRISHARDAHLLADAVEGILEQGAALRHSTRGWFVSEAQSRSVRQTAEALVELFRSPAGQAGEARK